MATKKQQAIELLKKETTDLANVYKKDGGFVLSGTYEQEEIGPGDYFIARKPKNPLEGLPWIDAMNKFDGVIQKCAYFGEDGRILSENTFMDAWWYHPSWCEKVSPGDVMKTGKHTVFIFKKLKNGEIFDYAFYSENIGLIIDENTSIPNPLHLPFSHATPEEAQPLFDALAKEGKRWNANKMCIEDMPKQLTYEEVLRSCGCSDEEIRRMENIEDKLKRKFTEDDLKNIGIMVAVNEIPDSNKDKPKELTESLANDGIEALNELNKLLAEFNEILPELRTGIMRDISYSSGKRDALKQVIKLCKKLLNE